MVPIGLLTRDIDNVLQFYIYLDHSIGGVTKLECPSLKLRVLPQENPGGYGPETLLVPRTPAVRRWHGGVWRLQSFAAKRGGWVGAGALLARICFSRIAQDETADILSASCMCFMHVFLSNAIDYGAVRRYITCSVSTLCQHLVLHVACNIHPSSAL